MKPVKTATIALDWSAAERLPIVGEMHPLRYRYRTYLYRGLVFALFTHMATFTSFTIARLLKPEAPVEGRTIIVDPKNFLPPPPLVDRSQIDQPLAPVIEVARAEFGIPEPVRDDLSPNLSFPTNDDFAQNLPVFDAKTAGWGEGDSLVVQIPDPVSSDDPSPEEFRAVEETPVLIDLPAPVYPEIARQAGVEGAVMVRALVGKDGKVQKAFVTESIPMLDEPAVAAVMGAVFKPALQQHRPVAVWVQVPMRFSLR